jgi:hypothetical protein
MLYAGTEHCLVLFKVKKLLVSGLSGLGVEPYREFNDERLWLQVNYYGY